MTSKIGGSVGGGNWKYAHGTAHYGRNFCVKWLKVHAFSIFFLYMEILGALFSMSETLIVLTSNLQIALKFT